MDHPDIDKTGNTLKPTVSTSTSITDILPAGYCQDTKNFIATFLANFFEDPDDILFAPQVSLTINSRSNEVSCSDTRAAIKEVTAQHIEPNIESIFDSSDNTTCAVKVSLKHGRRLG